MRLIRFGTKNSEKPGVLDKDGARRDLSAHFADWDRKFFEGVGMAQLAQIVQRGVATLPLVAESERWGAPVARPGKILCIGLNYSDHAAETGAKTPKEPIIFLKAANTAIGPYDEIHIPRGSEKTDWEVELGVIIGAEARYLDSPDAASRCVAGYCVNHDVSERAFQLERGGQWTKGKSCETFNPMGPWLATPDEIPSVNALPLKLWINGQQRQKGTTAKMIFDVPYLIHYISQFMTLEPGDLISTGTPPGVGLGMKPPTFLKAGDVVELEIDFLGRQKQTCVAAP